MPLTRLPTQTGDNCQQISINNTVSVDLFQQMNPSINVDCTNLGPGLYYCVLPVANWNITNSPTDPSTTPAPPGPTASGTVGSCYTWHTVQSGDYCDLMQQQHGITFQQLRTWNPSIDDQCSNLLLGNA